MNQYEFICPELYLKSCFCSVSVFKKKWRPKFDLRGARCCEPYLKSGSLLCTIKPCEKSHPSKQELIELTRLHFVHKAILPKRHQTKEQRDLLNDSKTEKLPKWRSNLLRVDFKHFRRVRVRTSFCEIFKINTLKFRIIFWIFKDLFIYAGPPHCAGLTLQDWHCATVCYYVLERSQGFPIWNSRIGSKRGVSKKL